MRSLRPHLTRKNMKPKLLVILSLPLLVFLGAFFLFAFASTSTYQKWGEGDETPAAVTAEALHRIGVDQPDWRTLVISVSKEVDVPRSVVWSIWTELPSWPRWSRPLHKSTRWLGKPGWRAGAEFEQVLNLGFPIGERTSLEHVGIVSEGGQVVWWKDENGIRSCHIWKLEELPEGRTRITNMEVFHGTSIGMIKILVGTRWLRLFELAVDHLTLEGKKAI